MVVIKMAINNKGKRRFSLSRPCMHCAKILESVGITNVVYSTANEKLVKIHTLNKRFEYSQGTKDHFALC